MQIYEKIFVILHRFTKYFRLAGKKIKLIIQ